MATPLSENDRRELLARALGKDEYSIKDVLPESSEVVYRSYPPDGNGPTRFYKCKFEISDTNAVKFGTPEEVICRDVYETIAAMAAFSLDDSVEFSGDTVIRTGKVFEIGAYPDKGFSLTEAEADAAIAAFSPVDNDLEHKRTILDGKLGTLQSVWRSGKDILGKVAMPKWLHESAGADPISTSLAWNTASKRIVGNGLVLHPRVKDAQLIAAFSAATEGGSTAMPDATRTKKTGFLAWVKAQFTAGNRPEGFEDADLGRVEFNEAEPVTSPAAPAPATAPEPDKPDEARFSATESRNIGLEAALLTREAEAFFSAALTASKVVPAERDALIAQFTQAAKDDARDAGVACFSNDGTLAQGSRLKALRDGVEARVPHGLTTEQITVFALGQSGDASKAAKQRLNAAREAHGLKKKED